MISVAKKINIAFVQYLTESPALLPEKAQAISMFSVLMPSRAIV